MNTGEKLLKLLSLCKCGVFLTVNRHRNYYMTAEEELQEKDERNPEDINDISPEIRKVMIEKNTIIDLQFYPNTPIGFYNIYHYDLDTALDRALSCIEQERKGE